MPKLTQKPTLAKQIKYIKNERKYTRFVVNTLEWISLIGSDFDVAESVAEAERNIEVLNAIEEQLIALSQRGENSQLSN